MSAPLPPTSKPLKRPTEKPALTVSSRELFDAMPSARVIELEKLYGNADLIRAVEILGFAGPYTIASPWELDDPEGVRRIAAGGYAALPFGEGYRPLLDFVTAFLQLNRSAFLPQQAASEWRAALAANLVALLAHFAPSHRDSQVFFTNSGTEAIETALKFARAARSKAKAFINFTRGYHGKTYGSLSLTPNEEYQAPYRPLMPDVHTVPYGDLGAFENTLKKLGVDTVCAVVLEPIQGEAGVIVPPEGFLQGVGELCRRHGVTLIADEIQTGLGRSGYYFASVEWGGMEPDIVTLAKPLGGGLMPVSATIARREIYRKMLGGLKCKSHSTTMGGNALGMAVALKSLELIVEEKLVERARHLGQKGLVRLRRIQESHPHFLEEVRGFGMLFALQFHPVLAPQVLPGQKELIGELSGFLGLRALHDAGVMANASFNAMRTVRLTPALTIPEALFDEMFDRIERAADQTPKAWQLLPKTPLSTLMRLGKLALGG